MDSAVAAAIISSVIAFLGVLTSVLVARWQISLQSKELELKAKELEAAAKKVESELEALRQTQFTEILRRRVETYPKLWSLMLEYNLNWKLARKPRDAAWASEHLSALNTVNAEIGIFFSQSVYEEFVSYRASLVKIEAKLSRGEIVDSDELDALETIATGVGGRPGLASLLKNDLGSYRDIAIAIPQPRLKKGRTEAPSPAKCEDIEAGG